MTALTVPLPYPLAAADKQRAINRVAIWVSLIHHRLSSEEHSREWLGTALRRGLREGQLTLSIKAVEAADHYRDYIADAALREVGAELQALLVQGRELAPGHLQVISYLQRAAQRAPHKRKPGRYTWHDTWDRNIGICILILLACKEFGVPPTRNRESRRADRNPSGTSLVTKGLARNKIHLDEGTIQRHIWHGVWGELVRLAAAERPIETWFQQPV
jgi:hypothetical protein